MEEILPFSFWADGVILTSVCLIGLLGTGLSIIVLLKPKVRDFFSSFLTALGIFDATFLFFAIVQIGGTNISSWYGNNISVHFIPYTHGLLHIARTGSVFVTMSVTLERYFAIVHPLKTFAINKFLLPVSTIFAIGFNIPKFFELETYPFEFTNDTAVRKTSLRKNQLYDQLYTFWSKVIILEIFPYITIIVLNTFIVIKICESLKFRSLFQRSRQVVEVADQKLGNNENAQLPTQTGRSHTRNTKSSSENIERLNMEPTRGKNGYNLESSRHKDTTVLVEIITGKEIQGQGCELVKNKRSSHLDREISLAITLVLISVLFVMCQSIKLIPDFYEMIYCNHNLNQPNSFCQTTNFIEIIISLSNLLSCLNSSANFLLYMLRGKKFRDEFSKTYIQLIPRFVSKFRKKRNSQRISRNPAFIESKQIIPMTLSCPAREVGLSRSNISDSAYFECQRVVHHLSEKGDIEEIQNA